MEREGFVSILGTLADAWNAGDSRMALDLLTDDAHYVELPDEQQMGAGEYTNRGTRTYHSITLIRLANDKIADWREYQYPSDLDWEAFSAGNRF
ncbi:MAG: hypothetical protein ABI869_01490 [Actinomycetota bacterium]